MWVTAPETTNHLLGPPAAHISPPTVINIGVYAVVLGGPDPKRIEILGLPVSWAQTLNIDGALQNFAKP